MRVVVNIKAKTKGQKPLNDPTGNCEVFLPRHLQRRFRSKSMHNIDVTYTKSDVYEVSEISTCSEADAP